MKPKKTHSSHLSIKTGMATDRAMGKVAKMPRAKVSGAKRPRTLDAGRKVVQADKLPVIGRVVRLGANEREGARVLERVLNSASEVTVSTVGGKTATLTGVLLDVLRNISAALEHGESVTVLGEGVQLDPESTVISSQEAANLLNVSRPFVVKLAKTGRMPYHLVGNRHRFDVADVLAYGEQMRDERFEALTTFAPTDGYTGEDF